MSDHTRLFARMIAGKRMTYVLVGRVLIFFGLCFSSGASAQELLAKKDWGVKQTPGHFDNRPQEVVFFLPGPGILQVVEFVQPFQSCGRGGWQFFVFQHRARGTAEWENGWPRPVISSSRTCQPREEGRPYRCDSTLNLLSGAENFQIRILLFPVHYRGELTPEQALSVSVSYIAQGQSGVTTPPETQDPGAVVPATALTPLLGVWDTTIQGTVKVMLEFLQNENTLVVRFFGRNGWEVMSDVHYNPTTGELTFRRPLKSMGEPDQDYIATIQGDTISGKMVGSFSWTGKKREGSAAGTSQGNVTKSGSSVNLARGKAAVQSSTGYGGTADRGVDGNTDGNYFTGRSVTHTEERNLPQRWWQVDLGTSASIDYLVIWNRTDCCGERLSAFWVLVSDTPFPAADLSTLLRDTRLWRYECSGAAGRQLRVPAGVRGRYVRIQLAGSDPLSLAEVEVFGR
jgi:hypothetical protein